VLFKQIETTLMNALNGLSARQKVIANNLANINTPGFKRSTVQFEKVLQESIATGKYNGVSLKTTNPKHITVNKSDSFPIVTDQSTGMRNDGNNVDMEQEVAQLTKDTLQYYSLVQLVNQNFSQLRTVVNEGRR
jgi:flagellar basal-body rod protein FlgB